MTTPKESGWRESELTPQKLASIFHDTYEALAPAYGYETRKETRDFDPESPNGKLMVAVCKFILQTEIAPAIAATEARVVGQVEGKLETWAAREHERWGRWQAYLHSQCFTSPEFFGALIIPADLVARWKRQIETPYAQLSEKEKESDREQVRPYLADVLALLN